MQSKTQQSTYLPPRKLWLTYTGNLSTSDIRNHHFVVKKWHLLSVYHYISYMTEVWLNFLPFLGHQNLHWLVCNIKQGDELSCWISVTYYKFSSWLAHCTEKHTVVSPTDLLLFFCMRQRTIRLRMRRAMKAMAPPVTIPSMGTSTRDCRNSVERWREDKNSTFGSYAYSLSW